MPVYADVLLAVNGFVNILLLGSAKRILKIGCSRYRLLLAAALGGIFSLRIFLPEMHIALDFALRTLMCALIVLTAFGFGTLRGFIRKFTTFFAVNLFYGGFMSAVFNLIDPDGMIYKNGTVYFDIDFKILAASSVAAFGVISLVMKITGRKSPNGSIYNVEIRSGSRSVKGRGFADTGNSLREIFTDTPVVVGSQKALKGIMPEGITRYLETGDADSLDHNIRLIPSSTAAGSALLPAFAADEIIISRPSEQYVHKNIYIAVSKTVFFGGEFEFLLNTELTEDSGYAKHYQKNTAAHKQACRRRYTLHQRAGNSAGAADKG